MFQSITFKNLDSCKKIFIIIIKIIILTIRKKYYDESQLKATYYVLKIQPIIWIIV